MKSEDHLFSQVSRYHNSSHRSRTPRHVLCRQWPISLRGVQLEELKNLLYQSKKNIHHTQTNQIDVRFEKRIDHSSQDQLLPQVAVGCLGASQSIHCSHKNHISVLDWTPSSD